MLPPCVRLVRLPYINCNWILQPGQYWCVLTLKSWIPVGSVMVPFFLVMFSHQQWNLRTTFSPPCPLSPPPICRRSLAHEFRQHKGCRCCGLLSSTHCMQRSLRKTFSFMYNLRHVSGLLLTVTQRGMWATKKQAHDDFFNYPSVTQGHILWPQVSLPVSRPPSCWISRGNNVTKKEISFPAPP